MSECFENACAEGALECGSASYRRSLEFQGGSFAAALHDSSRILMVSRGPPAGKIHLTKGLGGAYKRVRTRLPRNNGARRH